MTKSKQTSCCQPTQSFRTMTRDTNFLTVKFFFASNMDLKDEKNGSNSEPQNLNYRLFEKSDIVVYVKQNLNLDLNEQEIDNNSLMIFKTFIIEVFILIDDIL